MYKNAYNEIFNYFIENTHLDSVIKSIISQYRKRAKIYFLFTWVSDLLPMEKKKCKYLFMSDKYIDLIFKLNDLHENVAVISSPKSARKFIKNKIQWHSYEFIFPILTKAYNNKEILENDVKKVFNLLLKLKPEYIVVNCDSVPLDRLVLFCAKALGIKTITIQHGVWSQQTKISELDGRYADYVFVYDEHHKNILKLKGLDSNKIKVLGFYKNFDFKNISNKKQKICIIGRGLSRYSPTLFESIKAFYNSIYFNLNDEYDVYFKAHPTAQQLEVSEKAKIYQGSMEEAISYFDVFISDGSTSLLEVSLARKLAIQIYDEEIGKLFFVESFEELGYSYTVNNINDVISVIKNGKPYMSPQIEYSQQSVVIRFLDLIDKEKI